MTMLEICSKSLLNSFVSLVYIGVVAFIMNNTERIFGKMNGFLGPVTFLLLFTVSALIVGALLLGKPIMLYLDDKKKDAILWLSASIGWMALFTIIALVILALR